MPDPRRYLVVLEAALNDDETRVREGLSVLTPSELSRLRNTLHTVAELAEAQRKIAWRNR